MAIFCAAQSLGAVRCLGYTGRVLPSAMPLASPFESADPVLTRFLRDLDAQGAPIDEHLRPDLRSATPADIAAAQIVWANRTIEEHRAVLVFTELLARLAESEAPFVALAAVQRVIGDELRHLKLCQRVGDWLGGWDLFELDLRHVGLPPSDASPAERALEIVARELYVLESESVPPLTAYARAATDPAIRAVLQAIVRDEVRHAAAGKALLVTLRSAYPFHLIADLVERLPGIIERQSAHLREAVRAAATGGPGRALGASIEIADLAAASDGTAALDNTPAR